MFYYEGYQIKQNVKTGQRNAEIYKGNNGVVDTAIIVKVPSGYSGTITVDFQQPVSWRVANWLSLLFLIALIAWFTVKHRLQSHKGKRLLFDASTISQ